MKNESCWCGKRSYLIFSQFRTKIFQPQKSLKLKIVKCDQCDTVRMLDNSIEGEPDYESSYNYNQIGGRHFRTISIIDKYATGKSILDIGCNTGILLNEIKQKIPRLKYFKGIDLDSRAIEMGIIKYNLDLEAKAVEGLNGKFDNIVLCHTLEHVLNLPEFLKILNDLLNPGGMLFISVPNIQSLAASRLPGIRFWGALAPQYHVWYFDEASLSKCFHDLLPNYKPLHTSTFFIWKPIFYPNFYWSYLKKRGKIQKWETKMKGDQLDFVVSKPQS
ncbi:MAG: class I SAM-dependent methyltransferase [Cytophagales bacterium]|nr:class I SAM-dependent methyltransferase [Cytophagales bacterium]